MKAIIPPPKKRAPRKYWYALRTPAGDCLVSAECAGVYPAEIQRCRMLLARAKSTVSIEPISCADAYKLARHGVQLFGWLDKTRFILDVLRSFYTDSEIKAYSLFRVH